MGNALRADLAFQAKFGARVIPEMLWLGGRKYLFAEGSGVPAWELGEKLGAVAAADRNAAAQFAEQRYPGFRFSRNASNYYYNKRSGHITAWFDLLSDLSPHPALGIQGAPPPDPTYRWRDHVVERLGEGTHGEVFLLDQPHPDAPDPQLVVLKRYRLMDIDQPAAHERARAFVRTLDVLRASGVLQRRFERQLLPSAVLVSTGKVAMNLLPGIRYSELRSLYDAGSRQEQRANHEANEALELSAAVLGRDRLGGVDTIMGVHNFLVDPDTGAITGWPDPGLHL
jgi:hypothetical protein